MTMRPDRGATPEEDEARGDYTDGIIVRVDRHADGGGWGVTYNEDGEGQGGWGCGVRDVGVEPRVGDHIRVYGAPWGRFHGQALNGELLWYDDPLTSRIADERAKLERDLKQLDDFVAKRAELDAQFDALPPPFKMRITKFREANDRFRWEFESYEMSCCVDAVKIAEWCDFDAAAIEAFKDAGNEEWQACGISAGHSGNSFGFAVRLAYHYATDASRVVLEHGALTPLVGCEDYGCPHPYEPAVASA